MSLSLSLVICTYNNAPLLARCLHAIANQILEEPLDWQVLVVNNNCTDDTETVVSQYKSRINQLVMVNESRQGLTPARLCGVQQTQTDWIAFIDDDCIITPHWVTETAKFARSHPHCGAFGGRVILSWETSPPPFVDQFLYSFAEQGGEEVKTVKCLVGAGIVINRSALLETGWIDQPLLADRIGKRLVSGGDVELALRLGAQRSLWYTPTCQLHHIIPSHRLSSAYLMRINHALGTSKLYGDSMLWANSYQKWLLASLCEGVQQFQILTFEGLKALLGKQSKTVVVIKAYFWWGWFQGIWKLWWMDVKQRQAILGSAIPKGAL
mgnify:CR=1 FL=1